MNRNIHRVLTYVQMTLLLMLAGAAVLYFAGKPLVSYLIAKGNMIIVNGAPAIPGKEASNVSTLVMNEISTSDQSEIQVPEPGTQYGTITCERIALSAPVFYGDSDTVLENGVGQYALSALPGEGKPILMSAHDVTFFAPLEQTETGDIITITTDYGVFNYSVASIKTAEETDTSAYDLTQDKEQLILYTCYPFGQLVGARTQRFFVYCDLISSTGR